jgi:hypothetical protein
MSWFKSLAAIFLSKEIGTIPAIVVTEVAEDFLEDGAPAPARECHHHHHHAAKNDENPDYGDWI